MGFTYSNKLFGGTGSGVGFPSGALTAGRVVLAAGPDSIADDAGLTYDAATDTLTSGRVLAGDGSATAPGVSFAAEPGIGLQRSGAGYLDLRTGSSGQIRMNFGTSTSAMYAFLASSRFKIGGSAAQIEMGGASADVAADMFLTRAAAATLQLGAASSATPVAQTLKVQDGSGTNIPGANLTIQSGTGTGDAAGSTLDFKTPTPGVSGINKQTMATRLLLGQWGASVHDNIYPNVSDARKNGNAASGLLWSEVGVSRSVLGSKSKALSADATATDIFTIPLADGAMTAGEIIYRVTASAAGQKQVISGRVRYSAVRDNVTYDCDVSEVGTQTTSVTSGALTGAWTCTAAAGVLTLTANFDSSLDVIPTVYYRIDSTDTLAITPL